MSTSQAGRVRIACPELRTLRTEKRMSTIGARTRERKKKDLARAFLVSHTPKPEGTTRKKDPQAHFLRCQVRQNQEHVCGRLGRAGRLTTADPTQLRPASGREEAYQELLASQQMPWTARGASTWTSQQTFRKAKRFRGQTHLETCRQTSLTHKHMISRNHGNGSLHRHSATSQSSNNMLASSSTEAPHATEPDWSSCDTALEIHFGMKREESIPENLQRHVRRRYQ